MQVFCIAKAASDTCNDCKQSRNKLNDKYKKYKVSYKRCVCLFLYGFRGLFCSLKASAVVDCTKCLRLFLCDTALILGTGANGVIFVIDRDLNEIYLACEGSTQRTIPNSKCNSICDNTYIYATSRMYS